jgi:hypothetical protein
MRGLRLLLPIVFAVLFATAGIGRAMPLPAGVEPPCHMMDMGDQPAPKQKPPVDMLGMACCVACLAPAPQADIAATGLITALARPTPPVMLAPAGRTPSPEPDPPRAIA